MRVTRLFPLSAILVVGLALMSVQAAEEAKKGPSGDRRGDLVKRFDKNGDGKLDDSERQAAQAAMKGKGRPGAGDPTKRGPDNAEFIKRFDKNGDGKLDDSERQAAQEAMKGKGRPGAPGKGQPGKEGGREEMMKRFDKNGDGRLDDNERAAAREAMKGKGRPPRKSPDKENAN